jgi:hypothetical protein
MGSIEAYLPLLNLIVLPLAAWIIKVEKRLTRIETILESHTKGTTKTRKGE